MAPDHRIKKSITMAKKDMEELSKLALKCDSLTPLKVAHAQAHLSDAYYKNEITKDQYDELIHEIIRPADVFNQFCLCNVGKTARIVREPDKKIKVTEVQW